MTLIHTIHQYAQEFHGLDDQIPFEPEWLALEKELLQLLEPTIVRDRKEGGGLEGEERVTGIKWKGMEMELGTWHTTLFNSALTMGIT